MLKISILSVAAILLSSCASTKIHIPLPSEPELPTLTQEQDRSIPDDIYGVIIEREELLQAHIDTLRKLIKANNGE